MADAPAARRNIPVIGKTISEENVPLNTIPEVKAENVTARDTGKRMKVKKLLMVM